MNNAAIILAAGRGSRMRESTAQRPKCLLELAGKPLLHWQLEALARNQISKILVVRGYLADAIQGDFATVENTQWQSTNMLSSLLCANDFAHDFFQSGGRRLIVSYSDIVYHPGHIASLLNVNAPLAIAYDTQWEALWKLRFADPLADAETFRQEKGRLVEIGGRACDLAQIHGQYMGLLAFDAIGWAILIRAAAELGHAVASTDMTSFLGHLLAKGVEIGAAPVQGKWCESDNEDDLRVYEEALVKGGWSHDWRDINEAR